MSLFWNYLYDIQYNGGACCSSVCNTIKLHTCGSFIYSKNDAAGCSARAHAPAETDWPSNWHGPIAGRQDKVEARLE